MGDVPEHVELREGIRRSLSVLADRFAIVAAAVKRDENLVVFYGPAGNPHFSPLDQTWTVPDSIRPDLRTRVLGYLFELARSEYGLLPLQGLDEGLKVEVSTGLLQGHAAGIRANDVTVRKMTAVDLCGRVAADHHQSPIAVIEARVGMTLSAEVLFQTLAAHDRTRPPPSRSDDALHQPGSERHLAS